MNTVAFTSITPNYLAKARVLASSLKRFHPEIRFHLLLGDVGKPVATENEPFDEVVDLADLGLSTRPDWIFEHTVVELCTAIKGVYTERLLADPSVEAVLYFDPDIAVLGPLEPVFDGFREGSVLLTPHQIEPERHPDAVTDNEICCLRHGVFNLGFLALKNTAVGREFADWWSRRLTSFCQIETESGIFTDQRWVDLAPALFDEVVVLRHPGLNVATWNFTHRMLAGEAPHGVLVNGEPLSFFHFSGFDGGAQLWMSVKYAEEMPVVFDLRNWYIRACAEMGQQEVEAIPWTYHTYDNGVPIRTADRKNYRRLADLHRRFPNPFSTAPPDSYFHWLEAGGAA